MGTEEDMMTLALKKRLEDTITLLDKTNQNVVDMVKNNDQFFLIVIAIIIFFMQCGFAFLEAGSVRSKNTVNILIKNMLDAFIGGVSYWAIGWGLAYGGGGNPFCGGSEFFNFNLDHDFYPKWFFQFVFAATAATIVSGAIAERCQFAAYFVYSIIITGLVYPPVSHWAWDGGREVTWNETVDGVEKVMTDTFGTGWLAQTGYYKDFAGSGVVHLLGGTCALVGCYFMGARKGRFNKQGNPIDMPGHSVPLAALGGFILIFGFLAFNGGSQAAINSSPSDGAVVGLAIVNTILGGCSGGLTVLFINRFVIKGNKWSFLMTLNGALAGMVALCAGCDSYEPWASLIVGCGAGACFLGAHLLMLKFQLDDPLDAVAVHGAGGLWGLMILPFLMQGEGIFWKGDQKEPWLTLAYNLAGAIAIVSWSAAWSTAMFFPLSYFRVFRIPRDMEFQGVDIIKHGEAAYPAAAWEEVQYGSNSGNLPVQMRGGNRTANSEKKADDAYNNPFEMMPATGKLFAGMTNAFQGLAQQQSLSEPANADSNRVAENKAIDNKAFEADEDEKESV